VIEADRTGYQERLTHDDGTIEKGLTGPDALEEPALIPENSMEDSKPAAGWQNTFGDYPAHAGNLLPDICPGQRSKG
jgi:hypothetical protein